MARRSNSIPAGPSSAGLPPSTRSGAGFLRASDFGLPEHPRCPFCDGTDTELHSPFGSALSVATYWCRACRTAFERFKR